MDKLVSLDFTAKLGFAVAGAGTDMGQSMRAQSILDSSNSSNKVIVKNDLLLFIGASWLFGIKG